MKNEETPREQLQTIGTYIALVSAAASLLTALFTPIAKYLLGYEVDTNLFYALVALVVLPVLFLAYQQRRAAQRIETEGVVQRPQWFWRLLTHKITHRPQELIKGIVMVIVPNPARREAGTLKDVHNQNGQFNLLFHFLPTTSPGIKIDEDLAESKLNEEQDRAPDGSDPQVQGAKSEPTRKYRSLDSLRSQLEDCAGIVLLDDGGWKSYETQYPDTWKVINDWSNRFTFRPVMSIRVEGEGTLKYSWCHLNETIANNQSLLSHLLKLAADRGREWFNQATDQRRVFFALLLALVTTLIFSVITNVIFGKRLQQTKSDSDRRVQQLEDTIPRLTKLMETDPKDQKSLAEYYDTFRNSSNAVVNQSDAKRLLEGLTAQIKKKISDCSHGTGEVMMFALKPSLKDPDNVSPVEVFASRPHRDFGFHFNRKEKNSESIVSCAVVNRSFVHWSGVDRQSVKETKNIEVWSMKDESLGTFNGHDKWEYGGTTCRFGDPPKSSKDEQEPDDPYQFLLCAPVGFSDNPWVWPAGAICISSVDDIKLDELWARQLLLKYGNQLSFFNWDKALPQSEAPK